MFPAPERPVVRPLISISRDEGPNLFDVSLETPSLIPRPVRASRGDGVFLLRAPLLLAAPAEWWDVVETGARDLTISLDGDVVNVEPSRATIRITHGADLIEGAFDMRIDSAGIQIVAGDASGAAYALVALRQLAPVSSWRATPSSNVIAIPCWRIVDHPRFAWRGVHLDVARHFFSVEDVCRFIDHAAQHRLNYIHLHLNDDQGWRVELPSFPRLTEVGAFRTSSPVGRVEDASDDGIPHGGFYTSDDLAQLREHARRRAVTVVPEIDLPGHSLAVLAAYPEFGNTPTARSVGTRWGISHHVLNVAPNTLSFAEDVVCAVADYFPGSPVHIGGDECPTTEWEASEQARDVMRVNGFTHARQLQGLYTDRLTRALEERGHRVVAWDEVLDADVPTSTIIAAWRHSLFGTEAVRRGHDVIMAPMEFTYFDWPNSESADEPMALLPPPFATTWQKVYGFRVIPDDVPHHAAHHVIGTQAQLWTEYIPSRDHLDYMTFPRLSAFAEVAWGTSGDVNEFGERLANHVERLAALGINFRRLDASAATSG